MELILKTLLVFAIIAIVIIGYFGYFVDYNVVDSSLIQVQFGIDEGNYTRINGSEISLKNSHYVDEDILMIPIKDVLGILGGTVNLSEDEDVFFVDYLGISVNAYPKSNYVFLDGERQMLTRAPLVKDGVVFVPVDFFVKVLGFAGSNEEEYVELNKQVFVFNEPAVDRIVSIIANNPTGQFSKRQLLNVETIKIESEELETIDWISYFENLRYLHLRDNKINDISAIANLKKLVEIDLSQNKVEDIRPLGLLENLTKLNLSKNKITDASRLHDNRDLAWVDLSYNRLGQSDISLAEGVRSLDLSYNTIYDLSVIKTSATLDVLNIEYNPVLTNVSQKEFDGAKNIALWGIGTRSLLDKEVEAVRESAKDIVDRLGLRQMPDLDVRMDTVYDYLFENTSLRENVSEISPRNVLENGVGGKYQIANALQVLWRMSGAEVYTYVGDVEGEEHVWNIVIDNGRYINWDLASDIKEAQRSEGWRVENRFQGRE